MITKVLACRTLEDELTHLIQKNHLDYSILWIESGLHNVPKKLHQRLQEELDQCKDCGRILLAMGRCGNSVTGLKTGDYELIMPKVDDCISLFFGSDQDRNEYGRENAAIYLTEGWMRGERNLLVEYEYMVKRYGEDVAEDIIQTMYSHYRQVALLDTGVYPIDSLYEETALIENMFHLERRIVPATLEYLSQLLTGPWAEERFYRFAPHSVLNL